MATFTTTQAPLPEMMPMLQDYWSRAQELANQGYTPSPGTYTGPNNALQAGWQATANRAMQGSPVMGAANQQLTNTMTGGFLGRQSAGNAQAYVDNPWESVGNEFANVANPFAQMNNPYLQQSISDAQGDLLRSYNLMAKPAWDRSMQQSGSFGNTGVAEYQQNAQNDLLRNLGRIGNDMRMGAYNQAAGLTENMVNRQYQSGAQLQANRFASGQQKRQNLFQAGADRAARQDAITGQERGLMQNALGMAPTFANQDYVDAQQLQNVGQQMQGFDQGQADQNYRWWQEAQNYPRQQLAAYGQALGVGGGGTTTQTAPDPSRASQLLGGSLTGAMIYNMLFPQPRP